MFVVASLFWSTFWNYILASLAHKSWMIALKKAGISDFCIAVEVKQALVFHFQHMYLLDKDENVTLKIQHN
jgi:hypothetical protein